MDRFRDIPGLIEGAHEGAGLGLEFLRHVERTRLLVHLVEPSPMDGSDPLENYRAIRNELAKYSPALVERPQIIVVSKSELPTSEEVREQLSREIGGEVLAISAVTGKGLNDLIYRISECLSRGEEESPAHSQET